MLKVIYLGTPQFAVPTLRELIAHGAELDLEVVAVVCQPDRPKGRGGKVEMPPVKQLAQEHGIQVFQPQALAKSPETVEAMRALAPDLLVMVAFGQILKKNVLEMAPLGVINVHGSLLPQLRGAAPINWSIINGDTVTGVTTMYTEAGVDTGPMLLKKEIVIGPEMTAPELSAEMSEVGATLLIDTVKGLKSKTITPEKQDDSLSTLAPMLSRAISKIDFSKPASEIHNLVRGLTPWPGTIAGFRDAELKIVKTTVPSSLNEETKGALANKKQGEIIRTEGKVLIACGDRTSLELLEVQPANRAKLAAAAWVNGVRLETGECLS
jgi:methionyl-tRNA formyltransferase